MSHNHETELQRMLLLHLQKAAIEENKQFFLSRGLSEEVMNSLKQASVVMLSEISRSHLFEIQVSEGTILSRLKTFIQKEIQNKQIIEAVRLGASRTTINALLPEGVNISNAKFTKILKECGQEEPRTKAKALDEIEIEQISQTHANIKSSEVRLGRHYTALEVLMKLSEVNDIEINRLYNYYYKHNGDLFDVSRNFSEAFDD